MMTTTTKGTYWFTLTLATTLPLPPEGDVPDSAYDLLDEMLGKIIAEGCNDATQHCTGTTVYLSFAREANSLEEAIASARAAVNRAGYEVTNVELEPEG